MKLELNIHFNKFSTDDDHRMESWVLTSDKRHGKDGYRVSRYAEEPQTTDLMWDQYYMFFESLDVAYAAFLSGDLEEGRKSF